MNTSLPPANKVCEGYVFTGVCSQGGGVRGGGMHGRSGAVCGRGACVAGGCVAGETATPAGGTHPTGMHSCTAYFIHNRNAPTTQVVSVKNTQVGFNSRY